MISTTDSKPAMNRGSKPPLVLILAHSLMGHISPMCRIASFVSHAPELAHAVYFLGPSSHRARIEATGATFLSLLGKADIEDQAYYADPPSAQPVSTSGEQDVQDRNNEARAGIANHRQTRREAYAALPWHERLLIDVREQCLEPLPDAWQSFISALELLCERLRQEKEQRDVVVIAEAMFHGILPLFYDASLPESIKACLSYRPTSRRKTSRGVDKEGDERDGCERGKSQLHTICVSVTVPAIRSIDCPPLGYPFPGYDPSPTGRALNAALWDHSWAARRARPLTQLLDQKLRDAGARRGLRKKGGGLNNGEEEEVFFGGLNYTHHPTILQLGVPGLEYPRSDWPLGFRFAGFVQGTSPSSSSKPQQQQQQTQQPEPPFSWWPEILANAALPTTHPDRKKIIVVAQGTVETNPHDLILPTIEAFAPSSNDYAPPKQQQQQQQQQEYLIIAILGWKDAQLPKISSSSSWPPQNVRLADFLNYDTILAHADVWVHNAGFGALCHGIANGVVQVVCGEGMDKGENARRVAWSGIGVDLGGGGGGGGGSRPPAPAQVREAVEKVLLLSQGEGDGDGEEEVEGNKVENNQFKKRVDELRRQSEEIDVFAVLEEELRRLK